MMLHELVVIIISTVNITPLVQCVEFAENIEENFDDGFNSTTLYPVDKIPFEKTTTELAVKISDNDNNMDRTAWKINTSFAISKYEEGGRGHATIGTDKTVNDTDCKDDIKQIKNDNTDSKTITQGLPQLNYNVHIEEMHHNHKNQKTVTKKYNENEEDESSKKEFKPSPHLNSYYDTLDDSPPIIFTTAAPTLNTPTFLETARDGFTPHHNTHQGGYVAFPYKYETYSAIDNSGRGGQSLQSKPTIEAPVRIPVGGLYRHPDISREKPNSYEDNDYPLHSVDNVKDHSLKKRANPWKSLLQLVTALLPVGLIVSALTPTILTIEDTNQYTRVARRLDESRQSPGLPALPAVSEDCKRRLLCEIHSDRLYESRGRRRPKQCHKLRCEEPRALSDLLHWLLTFRRAANPSRGHTFL